MQVDRSILVPFDAGSHHLSQLTVITLSVAYENSPLRRFIRASLPRIREYSCMNRKVRSGLLFAVCVFATVSSITAQERGLYLPGFRGLNAAEQPGQGFTYANYFFYYPTDKFKGHDGNTVATNFDLDLVVDMNLFAYTTKKKFLGATYTAAAVVPVMNAAVTIPRLGDTGTGASFGDIYIEPLSLMWKLKKAKVRTAYGISMPTGAKRVGADYWGHEFSLGTTITPEKTGLWQINATSTWEAHHRKRTADVKVGNNVTFEYGVGKTFVRNKGAQLLQFGMVGYSQFQLTDDTGTGVVFPNLGNKDSVHAIGPEFGVILPAKKFNLMVRVLPEYGARSRTQGVTVVLAVGKTF